MFGKKKEVKSYEYMVEYCILGLMSKPTTLHITLDRRLETTHFNGNADVLFNSNKVVHRTNKDLMTVMGKIFESYAYMDLAEFKKRIVIIDIEGGM